jgi:adenosylcobinamide-phosphate synthase
MGSPAISLTAILIELAIGYPPALYARIGHPVGWFGALLHGLDQALNCTAWSFVTRRMAGIFALAFALVPIGALAFVFQRILSASLWGEAIQTLCVAVLLAPRSLREHVSSVRNALEREGLPAGRVAVSRIVGRDPRSLDACGVCRAAIESLAENFSDGVIAPLLWYLAGGLAGIVLYKAINTADSMIGHHNDHYEAFGWAAARLDDLVNLPASRLTAILIAVAAGLKSTLSGRRSVATALRDARRHRSPNAGWPEAAMAGALGIALAGPRIYDGHAVNDAWLGDGKSCATTKDLSNAVVVYDRALLLVVLGLALAALSRL